MYHLFQRYLRAERITCSIATSHQLCQSLACKFISPTFKVSNCVQLRPLLKLRQLIDNSGESAFLVGSVFDAKRDPANLDVMQRYQSDGRL